jgi:GT2 family glycosyltransferase
MTLSIIIINWHSCQFLERCLASIYNNFADIDAEVIVVDNASYDGSAEMVAARFPIVRFIQLERNIGFAAANNVGFAVSAGCYVLFLNPDTEVVNDAVAHLVLELQRLAAPGIVGARLLNSDGSVQMSSIQKFPTILNQFIDSNIMRSLFPRLSLWGTGPLRQCCSPCPVDVVSGACMMVRRDVFARVSGFSEQYFMYSEDVDLCFRVAKTGYTNYYVPEALVVHHGAGSSRGASASSAVLMRQSMSIFFRSQYGSLLATIYRLSMFVTAAVRCTVLSCCLLVLQITRAGDHGAIERAVDKLSLIHI